ncbi:hypothetical protein cypCar_00019679 [Cyprinus carpio]|nr:hypothetical protein cypCar_00019679 [Cyprinus carpio]
MAFRTPDVQLHLKTCFLLLLGGLMEAAQEQGSMYMWIDANQARVLIGFEEDILIVSEGKMAPFTHDFRKAQQRMPAIPVNIQHVNFTWQATDQVGYLIKRAFACSVVQVSFPCRGDQDGVAAFEVTILVMDAGGNIILRTPHNAIFFKTCQKAPVAIHFHGMEKSSLNIVRNFFFSLRKDMRNLMIGEVSRKKENVLKLMSPLSEAKCPGGCRSGGYCNERQVCECQDGFYGVHCEKALCSPRCLNGGLCMSPGVCICPPGYFGPSCERANCSTTCLNGGTCFHPGKCICAVGFEGSRCELSKCQQPCRNGGKCTGRNKCKCSKGYHGDLCSKGIRGVVSNSQRVSDSKHKSQPVAAKDTKEVPESSQPSETNYVV